MKTCAHAAKAANRILYCNKKSITSRSGEAILLFYVAPVRPYVDTMPRFVSFSLTQEQTGIDVLEQVEWKATKVVRGWSMLLYKERLREPGLFQPGEEAKGGLVAVSSTRMGGYREDHMKAFLRGAQG